MGLRIHLPPAFYHYSVANFLNLFSFIIKILWCLGPASPFALCYAFLNSPATMFALRKVLTRNFIKFNIFWRMYIQDIAKKSPKNGSAVFIRPYAQYNKNTGYFNHFFSSEIMCQRFLIYSEDTQTAISFLGKTVDRFWGIKSVKI